MLRTIAAASPQLVAFVLPPPLAALRATAAPNSRETPVTMTVLSGIRFSPISLEN